MSGAELLDGPKLYRSCEECLYRTSLTRTGCTEYFISARRKEGEQAQSLFQRAADALPATARIVSMEVFGLGMDQGKVGKALLEAFGPITWALTWIQTEASDAAGGIAIWAVIGPTLTPVLQGRALVGVQFEDQWARFCRIGGITLYNTRGDQTYQARLVLHGLETALDSAGMSFSEAVRTWFYNRDILGWYDGFNRSRNDFFRSRGVFQGVVPSSTAVGGLSLGGAALTGSALAIRPRKSAGQVSPVPSPLQCPALTYGSAFSRAIEVSFPEYSRLYVSGTASIAPQGHTEHVGDVEGQVSRTIEVIGALLESRGMAWEEMASGMAYVKRPQDLPLVMKRLEQEKLDLPLVFLCVDICREDLLFELELNAFSPRVPAEPAEFTRRICV